MPLLNDVNIGALNEPDEKIDSIVKQVNEHARRISNEDKTKIIKDASGTPRILFGEGADMFYGMKVSQSGIDVTGAADDELVFNSNQNVFKIVSSGNLTLPVHSTADPGAGNYAYENVVLASVPHGLSFKPAMLAYIEFTSGVRAQLPYQAFQTDARPSAIWSSYMPVVTSTLFRIDHRAIVLGGSWSSFTDASVKYYLLQETAD